MVVGTVFIMIFGLATVSLVDNVNESIKNSDYDLPEPRVEIVSAFDQEMSTGPVESLSISNPGSHTWLKSVPFQERQETD